MLSSQCTVRFLARIDDKDIGLTVNELGTEGVTTMLWKAILVGMTGGASALLNND